MPTSGVKNYKWANATQGIPGQIVYITAADTVDFTTAVTQMPRGVLLNAPKQNETAQVNSPKDGDIVQVLGEGTTDILIGDRLKTNATGRAIKAAAKSATYVATEVWIIGQAEEGFTTNADGLITARWNQHEGHWT
jgi:hypothetical protein